MLKLLIVLTMCFGLITSTFAQQKVTGTVTGEDGLTLPGVAVVQKGTSNGTTTDIDGKYTITVPTDAILEFSFVGMETLDENVNGRSIVDVMLITSTIGLGEVVVTALGIQREKKTLTYASQQVSGEDLMKAKSVNFMDAMSGKAAGLEIKKSASGAGGSTRVVLRGFKSLGGSSEPLYVIDGIPIMNIKRSQPGMWGGTDQGDGLSQLNPDDIESVNVLKGLNASILYGSQGANGVVLITTKKGRAGKTSVSLSSTTTLESVLLYPELQFDYGAMNGAKESWSETKGGTNYSEDQMKDFFNTGNNLVNSVTVSGGNNRTTAYFSYSNTSAKGIIPNNEYGKNNVSFKQSTKLLNDKLTLGSNVMLSSELINNRNVAGYYLNPLTGLYNFPRERNWEDYKNNYKVFDETRNMYLQNVYVVDHHLSNPYWIVNMEPQEEKIQRMIATASADYKFTDHMSLIARGTYDFVDFGRTQKDAAGSNVTNVSANGRYVFANRTDRKIYTDALLKYDNSFGKLNVLGYAGASYSKHEWDGMGADNGTNDLLYPNVFSTQNYPTNVVISEYGGETILQSVYASATVGYNDMIYVDISGRNDWSSTLIGTEDGASYFYPSVGVVALVSNIFELPEFISFLKVRASSAKAAKEVPWNAIRSDNSISGSLGGINRNTRQPWLDLKPELITSNELGFEFDLYQGRLGMDFTYYHNTSKDQFLTVDLPPEEKGQYTTKNINVGEIVNKGYEITLDGIPVSNNTVTWKTAFNFHANNNEIIELDPDNPERRIGMGSSEGYETYLIAGGSYGDLYGYMFRRNDAGQIMLDETSGRPLKTQTREYMGNLEPDWNLGWNNDIQIKRFSIAALISGKFGGKVVSQTEAMLDGWGVSKRTGEARDKGYVEINAIQGSTPVTQISAFDLYAEGGGTGGRNGIIEPYVYDRTNVRLSQLSIAYDIDVQKLNLPLTGATISLVGQNLFIFYKDAPYDPELAMNTTMSSQSLDNFNAPATRTYGFNLKVTF
ncbi:SusC/RagA family TonB-linked outer membrane protein [Prolixibacteraceae bacterium Z1-6]|uniref:SusC/RagA family TonB-linked outer membrane protein n=1 Tax=Draconibacterium aestuarii TaxID=2998507 RepID=A0A9X3J893_9BACT|nr:SusC/RagA family TonB-linked outer membrane protein [Prolixibacteraceae bacterium Z1-6]